MGAPSGGDDAHLVLSVTLSAMPARLPARKMRPRFYSRHCRVSRDYVAIETSARYPPAVAGPLPGRDDARLAAGRSRFELYLRHCRDTRDFVSNDTTARCPPAVAGAPAESKTRPGFYSRHCRVSRDYVAIDTTARYPPAVAGPLPGRGGGDILLRRRRCARRAPQFSKR